MIKKFANVSTRSFTHCTCFVKNVLVPGVIFVVDSNDRERVSEAQDELFKMLLEDELRDAVVLVLANKQVSLTAKGHSWSTYDV